MFDENSTKWIEIYKAVTKVVFWILVAAAVLLSFMGLAEELEWTDFLLVDAILALVLGGIVALGFLVSNMLVIQFLNNVQIIREKLEEKK